MPVQDDRRERQLIKLFGLYKRKGAGRGGTDAQLNVVPGLTIPFEVKSSTKDAVSTVRDLGQNHIEKWQGMHWLFGFYDTNQRLLYSMYGSPKRMEPWIRSIEDYIAPDLEMVSLSSSVAMDIVYRILGEKDKYSLSDARKIQKRQLKTAEYKDLMDMTNGYSSQKMLQFFRDRYRYLLSRGATLNNPKIPAKYFDGWEKITNNHAARLLEMVKIELMG